MPRKGNLAGASDRENPEWIANVLNATRNSPAQKKRKKERQSGMYLFFDDPFRRLLHEAAERRDISITGYGRRATAAFIAADLGLTLEEVTKHSAQPMPYGKVTGGGVMGRTFDDGKGHGNWSVRHAK